MEAFKQFGNQVKQGADKFKDKVKNQIDKFDENGNGTGGMNNEFGMSE